MKISADAQASINSQIKEEFESAFIYLSMEAWFSAKDLGGFASWMRVQYREETEHAFKMLDYLVQRDGSAEIPAIAKAQGVWKSPLEIFEAAYKHEQYITTKIYAIVEAARKTGDLATENFYRWFVSEQVEEEASALSIVKQLKIANDNPAIILMIDRQLAARARA